MSMQPHRLKRNTETRVRGESAVLERPPPLSKTLQLLKPKHARLVYYLNRRRLHTLWILLSLQVLERTRARDAGKRKNSRTRE